MSLKLTKLFIEFTSDILSDNSSLNRDDIKKSLMNKDSKQKFDDFIKSNKIRQRKDKKDSNSDEPKKPRTSYIIFCSEERENLTEANPDVANKDITSLLGKRWKEIQVNDVDIYEKYTEMAMKEKAEYEEKMREYRILHNIPEKIIKVKKPVVVRPEKPMSAYHYFLKDRENDVILNNPTLSRKDIRLKIKEEWTELRSDKDDIVEKYKKIAKDKKNELSTAVTLSTQTSPIAVSCPQSPVLSISPLNIEPSLSNCVSPVRMTLLSPDVQVENEEKKKKIKKNKKKLIRKVVEKDDEDDDDE